MPDTPPAELAVEQRTIPALPFEHDGQAITWRPWVAAPVVIAHVPMECHQCAHPGPPCLAFGLVGDKKPVIRYNAIRCPSCQEMTVYRRDYPRFGVPHAALVEIAYSAPRTADA